MPRLSLATIVLTCGILLTISSATAREFDRLYAQGVQAYFNGASHRADGLLTEALTHNHRDPRAYYFRGLARLRAGQRYAAEQDFRIGASMEANWAGRPIAMGQTLQRIQGSDRLMLERIRREARESHDASATDNLAQRYQQTTNRGKEVIHTEFRLPLNMLTASQSPDDLAKLVEAQANAAGDPFADDPVERIATPIDIPDTARGSMTTQEMVGLFGRVLGRFVPDAAAPAAGDADLFGADALADDDPFGAAPAAAADDPFGGDAGGGDDPFAPAAPAGDDPFGAPAGGDDPFGGPAGDDPFGAPAGDDPFGAVGGDPFGG